MFKLICSVLFIVCFVSVGCDNSPLVSHAVDGSFIQLRDNELVGKWGVTYYFENQIQFNAQTIKKEYQKYQPTISVDRPALSQKAIDELWVSQNDNLTCSMQYNFYSNGLLAIIIDFSSFGLVDNQHIRLSVNYNLFGSYSLTGSDYRIELEHDVHTGKWGVNGYELALTRDGRAGQMTLHRVTAILTLR